MPLTWLDLDLWGSLIRHGNASENYDRGDGSYYDDGFYDADTITFYGPSRFLTQKTLEIVFQTGINAYFNFPLSWGELTFGLGYTFQYVWNKDLNAGSNELNNFLHLSFGVKF